MDVINISEISPALKKQNQLLENCKSILKNTIEHKLIMEDVFNEMQTWKTSITKNQPSTMARNMKGSPFTALNYVKKLFTDFLYYNGEFTNFYKTDYNRPIVNMLLQKKIEGIEFINSDFDLLEILVYVYEVLHLSNPAKFHYVFAKPTLENYIIHQAIGEGKYAYNVLILSPETIKIYKTYKRNINSKIPRQIVSFVKGEGFPVELFVKSPVNNLSILYTEKDDENNKPIYLSSKD